MPFKQYRTIAIRSASLALIHQVNKVIDEYNKAGYSLTLRQVYYQMVARDILPNNLKSYKNLGELISNGRLTGLIDWYAIEDRTRYIRRLSHWDSPADIIQSAAAGYRRDKWADQPHYVEVWIEKDALISIVEQVANAMDVPCFSCRGYTSQSEMWHAAQRLISKSNGGEKPITIIHLGDHDPSGIDMTRDIEDRLNEFGEGSYELTINRIALNRSQIDEYNPPPNPAKLTDTRSTKYIERFGKSSWELDALNPKILSDLIRSNIEPHIDNAAWKATLAQEAEEKSRLDEAQTFVDDPSAFMAREIVEDDYTHNGVVESEYLHKSRLITVAEVDAAGKLKYPGDKPKAGTTLYGLKE